MSIAIFVACSLINVMLSTTKTILTIKSTRGKAAIINAITFGFYAVVIKQLATFPLPLTIAVTIGTNLIGVYSSLYLLDKLKKDDLWKISVTCSNSDTKQIAENLRKTNISYNITETRNRANKNYIVDIFSKSQFDSLQIKEILEPLDLKYHVIKVNYEL